MLGVEVAGVVVWGGEEEGVVCKNSSNSAWIGLY